MTILFISDLHLQEERPDLTRAFLYFLDKQARSADALYILGDFFEAWVGDDDTSPLAQAITDALTNLTQSGVQVYFQHGNRDFLVGSTFAHKTGITLLPEQHLITLGDQQALLMHGDSLCTQDKAYLEFRQQVRSAAWQQAFLSKPIEARRQIAAQLRESSREAGQRKDSAIMDVTPEEVARVMRKHNVNLLIHGHTHRPAVHDLQIDNAPGRRIVLGDWDTHGWVLIWQPESDPELKRFKL